MGLLAPDYYNQLQKKKQAASQIPAPQTTPAKPGVLTRFADETMNAAEDLVTSRLDQLTEERIKKIEPALTAEQQAEKFGGPVGSPEYLNYLQEHPLKSFGGRAVGEALGMKFPDQEIWDKMTITQQVSYGRDAAAASLGKMLISLPKALIRAPISLGYNIIKPISDTLAGKPATSQSLAEAEPLQVPWIGSVPTYFRAREEAIKGGMGPVAATLTTAFGALGDVAIAASLAEAATAVVRNSVSRGAGGTGVIPTVNRLPPPGGGGGAGSAAEYYSLPQTIAKKFGGNSSNTYFKVTPASIVGENAVEISVVKVQRGLVDKLKKTPAGSKAGSFGPEVKLNSQVIKLGEEKIYPTEVKPKVSDEALNLQAKTIVESGGSVEPFGEFSNVKIRRVPENEIRNQQIGDYKKTEDGGIEVLVSDKLSEVEAQEVAIHELVESNLAARRGVSFGEINKFDKEHLASPEPGALPSAPYNKEHLAANEAEGLIEAGAPDRVLNSILPRPVKGMDKLPITEKQVQHLAQIAEVTVVQPAVADSVMKTLTGKSAVGELTQAEYVTVSQALASFKTVADPATVNFYMNWVAQYASPQRNLFRSVENRAPAYPVYSQAYVPIEEAARLTKFSTDSARSLGREIHGKYAGPKYAEERRLLVQYVEGNQEVILKNPALSDATKQELIGIANRLSAELENSRVRFGIENKTENYQSHIANLGGVYQLYKADAAVPEALDFFAEHARRGSLAVRLDDSLALWDIYHQAGYKKMFYNPVLERVQPMIKNLPRSLQDSVKTYVQEKLGYAGRFEQAANDFSLAVGKKMGWDVPPDAARQAMQIVMDTTYAGALVARPDALVRNSLQSTFLVFPRLGSRFHATALTEAVKPSITAKWRDRGFLVEGGVPFGEALARETGVGGKVSTTYRNATQQMLQKTYGFTDNYTRVVAAEQWELIWNEALGKFRAGKLTYNQFEDAIDIKGFHNLDQNIIRERLQAGDAEGAMIHGARTVVDETNFPYRRGTSARLLFGAGKIPGQFATWPIEYAHTLGGWVRRGQWDKLIRFVGAATAVKRTAEETFGFDISNWILLNPLRPSESPFLQTVGNVGSLIKNVWDDNHEKINENVQELKRTLKSVGRPAGVAIRNYRDFMRSINMSKNNPRIPQGQYGVFGENGKLKYVTDFADVVWSQLFGFPTTKQETERKTTTDIINANFDNSQIKQKVLELLRQENYDKAADLIGEFNIRITEQDLENNYTPLNERLWNSLAPMDKAKFAPQVFK